MAPEGARVSKKRRCARIFFTASEGKEGKEENGSLEAPVNSEHEATVDWKQEAKVRRMKAESN